MHFVSETITHVLLFIALYFEVFFLITYFEHSPSTKTSRDRQIFKFPSVSIIVPVWNEESTVLKTIFSLLRLNYPKEKLSVIVVDDGSTDKTWSVIQRFKNNKQVRLLKKENGGKHTALNYALEFVDSELVGCLDSDSFVHPEALRRMVPQFEDGEIMAVTPSIKVFEPRGFLGMIQKAEYLFGIFLRKVFCHLNALYVAPGPFSIFRRSVFRQIGNYRHAHNTEDMEMAMRMHRNNMKIGNTHDAYVYTVAPKSLVSLYKQRLRWVYGFIKNSIDYRDMFLRPQYGNLGMAVLPAAGFSIFSTVYLVGATLYDWADMAILKIKEISTIGLHLNQFNFDFFYVNTDVVSFIAVIGTLGTIVIIAASRKLAEEKTKFGLDSIVFMLFYALLCPIWITKALYNAAFAKKTNWR